jgi:hypothetical protein
MLPLRQGDGCNDRAMESGSVTPSWQRSILAAVDPDITTRADVGTRYLPSSFATLFRELPAFLTAFFTSAADAPVFFAS